MRTRTNEFIRVTMVCFGKAHFMKRVKLPIIVECIGTPGSGKTTTMIEFARKLRVNNINFKCSKRLAIKTLGETESLKYYFHVLWHIFLYFYSALVIIIIALRAGLSSRSYRISMDYILSQINISSKTDFLLYDQYILNFLITNCAINRINFESAQRILAYFNAQNIIVQIKISPEIAFFMANNRKKNHYYQRL
jgi:hypothetical protein